MDLSHRLQCRYLGYPEKETGVSLYRREYDYNVPDEMADNVLAPAETEEQLERLEMAIDQLSGEEKALITLFYYEEKSMEEIGEVLKLSISNVKVRLHRTRKKICVLMNNK